MDTTVQLRSPEQYRASLRDGRRIYYRGERVEDLESHPALRFTVDTAAVDYEMAESPEFRDLAIAPEGYSRFFQIPRSAEDLLARSELIEVGTRIDKTLPPLIKEIGSDALLALLALRERVGEPYAGRIEAFYERVRAEDLALCVAQTDFKGDRSLPPSKQPNPDAYLRIVERREDGIVVRGAKAHTSTSVTSNEMIVLPTRDMGPEDSDYAVSFAIPLDTPGLTLVASPYLSPAGKTEAEHPISAGRKIAETATLFDDVFVPWERVFLAGESEHTGEVARGFVEFHRFTAISYKLPLVDALVGSGILVAKANGIDRAGHVRDKLSWLVSYAETLRALTHHSALRCTTVNGVAIPDPMLVNIAKLQFAQGLHTALGHLQDMAGALLVTYPSPEDMDHPDYGPALHRYLQAAGGVDGEQRLRVLRMISDLTTGEFGGYQAVAAIHAEGSIEAEKLTILAKYDARDAVGFASWMAGLDGSSLSFPSKQE
jgi:4-hydroxybutyryl-CoA dehydratase / vinylacetyl-CoA-Delta-isomerase